MKKMCAIVIPVYADIKKTNELIAIRQAFEVFKDYDIIAVSPQNLLLQDWNFTKIERFDKAFFESVSSYNKLMLSAEFYHRFSQYEFILIYQLDAYVFEDRLMYFCNSGYDYIGAPWLCGTLDCTNGVPRMLHVGNGGLSLRRVARFASILDVLQPLKSEQIKNEDLFFSAVIHSEFKIAPIEIALQFAFERQVRKCYKLNGNRLPFGCHAWQKYDLDFWKKFIGEDGYFLEENADTQGKEDIAREEEYRIYSKLTYFLENHYYDEREIKQKIQAKCKGREIAIFGAGLYGKNLECWLENVGIPIRGFCDNDKKLVGKRLNNYWIWSAGEIVFFQTEIYIIIANYEYEKEIALQLDNLGFKRGQDYLSFSDFVASVCEKCISQ